MSELKPCPFCGCGDIDEYEGDYGNGLYCMSCGAMMGEQLHDEFNTERVSIEQATEAWNKRADESDAVHISRLSPGFQCDGSVWKCCGCGAFFTNYTDMTDHHKPRFCPSCGARAI